MAHALTLDSIAWSSPWARRSVRDKGILSLGLLAAAVSLPAWPGGAAVSLVSLALLLGPIRVGWRRLAVLLMVPLVSVAVGVATVSISVSWDGGPRLAITDAGLATAAGLSVRACAATLAMFTLACSTPLADLLSAARRIGVPAPLTDIAALVYRFTFGLVESAAAVHAAQVARLGYVNRRAGMRSASLAVAALFLRAWTQATRLEAGLAGRGYSGSLNTLELPRQRSSGFVIASVAVLVGVVALAVGSVLLGRRP